MHLIKTPTEYWSEQTMSAHRQGKHECPLSFVKHSITVAFVCTSSLKQQSNLNCICILLDPKMVPKIDTSRVRSLLTQFKSSGMCSNASPQTKKHETTLVGFGRRMLMAVRVDCMLSWIITAKSVGLTWPIEFAASLVGRPTSTHCSDHSPPCRHR